MKTLTHIRSTVHSEDHLQTRPYYCEYIEDNSQSQCQTTSGLDLLGHDGFQDDSFLLMKNHCFEMSLFIS